jgi:hypothetical protein
MTLAFAGLAEEQQIFFVCYEPESGELFEFGLWDTAIERGVPVFDFGGRAKAGASGQRLGDAIFSEQCFVFEEQPQELQRMHLYGKRFGGPPFEIGVHPEQSQLVSGEFGLVDDHASPPPVSESLAPR